MRQVWQAVRRGMLISWPFLMAGCLLNILAKSPAQIEDNARAWLALVQEVMH